MLEGQLRAYDILVHIKCSDFHGETFANLGPYSRATSFVDR